MNETWTRDTRAALVLWYAAAFYLVAWAIHTGDHLRRGLGVVSTEVAVLGSVAAVLQLLAVSAVFLRWRGAAILAAAVGFPDAVGIAAVHLLPHWSSLSDAFPGAHGTGVNAFSWAAAVIEIAGALAFGAAGLYAVRRST
jgi:hypothetical protein